MPEVNPYQSTLLVGRISFANPRPPVWFRCAVGVLAVSGVIYVPTIVWLITYPGFLIWIGWITIVWGSRSYDNRWFWLMSLVWNAGMLVFTLGETWDRLWMNVPAFHSLLATLLSIVRLTALSSLPSRMRYARDLVLVRENQLADDA